MRVDVSADNDKKRTEKEQNENVLYTIVPSFEGSDVILILWGEETKHHNFVQNSLTCFIMYIYIT